MTNKHRDVTCNQCDNGMMAYIGDHIAEVYKCQQCGNVDEVDTTDHADDQWRDRSRMHHTDPVDAWTESVTLFDHGYDAEVARYHHPSRITFLMKRSNIVTCIHTPSARYVGQRAAIQAMIRVNASNVKIANLVNECGINRTGFEQIVEHMDRTEQGDGSAGTQPRRNQHSRSET